MIILVAKKFASQLLTKKKTYTQLVIPIPKLKINSYEFNRHEKFDSLTHMKILAIEIPLVFSKWSC